MIEAAELSADDIRSHLLARVEAYATRSGMSVSAISKEAVKDDRFVARARAGANFTVKTYQQMMDWLDAQESDGSGEAAA